MYKKKDQIATITFHWATNYGAVLQAYSLQTFLMNNGFDTEIINYVPWKNYLLIRFLWIRRGDFGEFIKEIKLKQFRKKHLKCSKKYLNNKALHSMKDVYSSIVCGSDQIWNMAFTFRGERRITLSYFLDFAKPETRKIAYAVSFGTENVSEEYVKLVTPYVKSFRSVMVREQSGVNIVKKLGDSACVVCDPTALLSRDDYERLIDGKKYRKRSVFGYILHNDKIAQKVYRVVQSMLDDSFLDSETSDFSMEEWIYHIKNSRIVITNSFHGLMLSLIFNTPVIAVLKQGSGMNDRLVTIMKTIGLEKNIVIECNNEQLNELVMDSIDWVSVNSRLQLIRDESAELLINAIR